METIKDCQNATIYAFISNGNMIICKGIGTIEIENEKKITLLKCNDLVLFIFQSDVFKTIGLQVYVVLENYHILYLLHKKFVSISQF